MKVLVTGGAGFVGSHIAEFYARNGNEVKVIDNFSRGETLAKADKSKHTIFYNWNYLKQNYANIILIKADVRNSQQIEKAASDVDLIVHTAAQVAVTTSITDPLTDFEINALGTLNVLEAARKSRNDPAVVYCSTNKVYGENVNEIPTIEQETRYAFSDEKFKMGIPETFPIDLCAHTPYGCSKITGDFYMQDYSKSYGLNTCVFRMSCIYGDRQFGNEDQGWVAHFAISTLQNRKLTIYGDGKQVRDVLFVDDLVQAFARFFTRRKKASGQVFNIGGGPENTLSLLELLSLLHEVTGRRCKIEFKNWRTGDQKVYISNISKAQEKLDWKPRVDTSKGIRNFVAWFQQELSINHGRKS
ncbi:MAG: GDP-mannose 4,6-dehydratase [Candidatus Bathyarchaeota archaeon]|nr:GDP-mannose 4,6-dehydratase [Candidatus Bathyarchaeota archaeon]